MPINIILHEFGHAFPAALLTKNSVQVYIGSLGDKNSSFEFSFWRFTIWVKYNPLLWTKGLCKPLAIQIAYSKQIAYILCGPLLPFAIAVIFSIVFANSQSLFLNSFITVFFYFSLAMVFTSLIPVARQVKKFDGTVTYNDGFVAIKLYRLRKYSREYIDANTLFEAKDYSKAGAAFNFLIGKNIHYEDIYRKAFLSFLMSKNYERAFVMLKYFENYFTLNSDDLCNSGVLKLQSGLYIDAQTDFKKSLALNPENSFTLNNIGYCYILTKQFNEAMPYLDKAILLNPSFVYAFNNRGLAKIKIGRTVEGLNEINKAIELDAKNAYGYRNLGIYYQDIGNYSKALELFKKAYELDADTHLINELIKETESLLIDDAMKA
jgi:tetratricopeptide (TPR) repeat protein